MTSPMSVTTTFTINIDPPKLIEALDEKYEAYAMRLGDQIRDAALQVYTTEEKKTNEERTSQFSPPKYISEFRVSYYRETRRLEVANDDPGWWIVEFGAHPGGNPRAYIRPMKPLRRGLMAVVVRNSNG